MDRTEKINRIAEAGHNICGNFFFSNAERMMRVLEEKDCDELKIALNMKLEKKETDGLNGVGKVEFGVPQITLVKSTKFTDKCDDVILDFINPDLPGLDENDQGEGGRKMKRVAGKEIKLLTSGEEVTYPLQGVTIYKDKKGQTYYAGKGIGESYMTFKGLPTDGSRHRYVNKALPVCQTLGGAQSCLKLYAEKKGWENVTEPAAELDLGIKKNLSNFADKCNENAGCKEKRGRKKKDTMKVERTLNNYSHICQVALDKRVAGCCDCEEECEKINADSCVGRLTQFGNAAGCNQKAGCSSDCPRLIKS